MQELLAKILGLLEAANGSLTWDDLKAQLDPREYAQMSNAVKLGRSTGQLHRQLRYDTEAKANALTVHLGPKSEPEGE